MPSAVFSTRIANLVDLSDDDKKVLEILEIKTEHDLSWVDFEDLPDTIPIVKHRKLNMIGAYLTAINNKINASTTLSEIRKKVCEAKRPPQQTVVQTAAPSNPSQAKVDRKSLKVTTNPLAKFLGYPWHWEDWSREVKSTLGQTLQYDRFLTTAPDASKDEEVTRDKELFHMLSAAIGNGHALNIVEKCVEDINKTGYQL